MLRSKITIYLAIMAAGFVGINLLAGKVYAACSTIGAAGTNTIFNGGAANTDGGAGVTGASACISGAGSGGGGGGGASGGTGGDGGGGGVLIKNTSGSMSISGTIDARGGSSNSTNGGTVKLFYTGSAPSTAGISAGRIYAVAGTTQSSQVCVPSSVVDDNSTGVASWSGPASALKQDGLSAIAQSSTTSTQISHYLKATGCSLSIPSNAIVTGVRVDYYRTWQDSGFGVAVTDSAVRLVVAGTAQTTDRSGASWGSASSFSWAVYGGPTDLWGSSLTPSVVNSSDFGVAISASIPAQNSWGTDQAQIDSTHITVYYVINEPPAAPTLYYPVSSANGTSVLTNFNLRSSDPEGDYLKYKIDVCADSSCNTIIRTIDQTSSQIGWTGQDQQAGTAYTGNSNINNSTMAVYNYQSPYLSANTSYWWRGYAIDPGGSNTWAASPIQGFTTAPTETHFQGNINVKGNVQIK